jgi:hypothetical protein
MSGILLSDTCVEQEQTMEDIVLIPTSYKSKLPHALSYPIGAETISLAFKGVSQFADLDLEFWFWSRARPDIERVYTVLVISYSRRAKSLHSRKDDLEAGRFEPKWTIAVRPVSRVRRHLIKTKLQEEALPLAKKWLIENGDRDEIGGVKLTFSFDEETEMLTAERWSSLAPRKAC